MEVEFKQESCIENPRLSPEDRFEQMTLETIVKSMPNLAISSSFEGAGSLSRGKRMSFSEPDLRTIELPSARLEGPKKMVQQKVENNDG